MMLSCKDVSILLSDRMDQKLRPMERLGLRIHLALCDGCTQVERQMSFIRTAMSKLPKPRRSEPSGRESGSERP